MFRTQIESELKQAIQELGFKIPTDIFVSVCENPKFGDYSSNIALQLSKQQGLKSYHSAQEIASDILHKLGHPSFLERIEVAGAGFINFFIKDSQFVTLIVRGMKNENIMKKRFLVEYGDPNTHKMLHIGHLVPLVIGESFARLLEYTQGSVFRANYGSDIGPTVAKTLWGIEQLKLEYEAVKNNTSLRAKADFLGKAYAFAHKAYTEDEAKKLQIDQLTKKIYARDESIMQLWQETTEWSLTYFDVVYSKLGIEFDLRINESEIETIGKEIVLSRTPGIFVKDDGAIIFPGENYGLHNRVFINSAGNPTYEAKDLGLSQKYFELDNYDAIYSLAHREQNDYFKVVLKAIERVFGEEGKKRHHISFGELRLPSGKMSSREGNIIPAEDMLDMVAEKLKQIAPDLAQDNLNKLAVGSIKFWLLKYSTNSDIVFDLEKSVSLQGDSGAYVMYVYARIQSLLNRANVSEGKKIDAEAIKMKIAQSGIDDEERMLLRQIEFFDTIVSKAAQELQPSIIAAYLLHISKVFNSFYEKTHIIGSEKKDFRLLLVQRVAEVIQLGLFLLGIDTVDRM